MTKACGTAALLTAIFAALPFAAAPAGAQSMPLDDKARYEKALEQKVDEVLLKLLGPNQAKVVVQASMDFTRTEKVDVTSGGGEAKNSMFKWESAQAGAGQPFNEYLLPGFPSMGGGEGENKSYQKQTLFPVSFIKSLTVTVIVNKTLPEAETQNVRSVVSEVLGLDPKRGDALAVIRTPFASVWRTIWYTPEAINLVFKYGILSIIGIISMIVVAIGFLKLAGAMNTMAKAQQSHQITMDLGKGMGGGMGGGGGLPGMPGVDKVELLVGEKKDTGGEEPAESPYFNVKPDQVEFLVTLMSGEDPANVSLVAGNLAPDVKSEFLRRLPPEVSGEVMANLARMRFVEPDVISTIREELEKRLAGAFGGVHKVVDALGGVGPRARREMLEKLERTHPDIAREVRPKVFLPEDLAKFADRDLSLIASSVKIEEWAIALWGLPPLMKQKLKAQLTEKAWAMLEQTMKYGSPSDDKIDGAVEGIVASALRLINEGRVVNPLLAAAAEAAGTPAEAPVAAAPVESPAAAAPAAPPPGAGVSARHLPKPSAPLEPPPGGNV